MTATKPVAQTVMPWLRANLGDRCLAPLTGTDARALMAAVQIIELYSYHDRPEIIQAFGLVVGAMQPHCQEFAYHSIAHVMNWEDRSRIWVAAGLPEFAPRKCSFEPGGKERTYAGS
jgi:hypothetical protein